MSARFNLEFPDDYKEIVNELMEKTGLRTQKDVFENALAFFGWGVREASRGHVIASLNEETKTYGQIHMPALMKAASVSKSTHKKQELGPTAKGTPEAEGLEDAHTERRPKSAML
jgi:Ca2+-binding EF-hand superfamily protein